MSKVHTEKLVGKTEIQKCADDQHSLSASVNFENGTIKNVVIRKWLGDMHLDLMIIGEDYLPVLVEVLRELIDVLEVGE